MITIGFNCKSSNSHQSCVLNEYEKISSNSASSPAMVQKLGETLAQHNLRASCANTTKYHALLLQHVYIQVANFQACLTKNLETAVVWKFNIQIHVYHIMIFNHNKYCNEFFYCSLYYIFFQALLSAGNYRIQQGITLW